MCNLEKIYTAVYQSYYFTENANFINDIIHNTHSSKHHNTDVYYYCVLFISSEKNTRYRLEAKKRNLRN